MILIPVHEQSQVAEARRRAVELAERAGFDESGQGRVAIVATELATNLVKHGRDGRLIAGLTDGRPHASREADGGSCVELIAIDKGPGIANLQAALGDGFSTAGSSGNGLGAIRRQSDLFRVWSQPGLGTATLARVGAERGSTRPSQANHDEAAGQTADWGAVCVAKPGEEACGDDWHVFPRPGTTAAHERTVMVVDGLGHGPQAAEASAEAVRIFRKHAGTASGPAEIVGALHAGLRATRGAAVSIARFDAERRLLRFCGVGNVAGALLSRGGGEAKRLMSHNGTVGHTVRRIAEIDYPYPDDGTPPVVVLHSDGVSASWSLGSYPGLAAAHPSLLAAVLFRDWGRLRDDATVLVAGPGEAGASE